MRARDSLLVLLRGREDWEKQQTQIDEPVQALHQLVSAAKWEASAPAEARILRNRAQLETEKLQGAVAGAVPALALHYRARWHAVGASALTGVFLLLGGAAAWLVFDRELHRRRLAQLRLGAAATHFRSLVEQQPDPIAVLDSSAAIVYASAAWQSAFQYPPTELQGRNLYELIHPADRPRVQLACEQRDLVNGVACRLSADYGIWHDVELRCQQYDGEWPLAVHIRNLRETAERNREAPTPPEPAILKLPEPLGAHEVPALAYVYEPAARRFSSVSNLPAQLLGYPVTTGCDAADLLATLVHPDDEANIYRGLAQRCTNHETVLEDEIRLRDAAGEYQWFAVCHRDLPRRGDAPRRIAGVAFPIQRQKRAEELRDKAQTKLRRHEEEHRRLEHSLQQHKERCEALEADLHGHRERKEAHETVLRDHEHHRRHLEHTLHQRDEQCARLHAEMQGHAELVETFESTLRDHEQRHEHLQESLRQRELDVQNLEEELRRREDRCRRLDEELRRREEHAHDLHRQAGAQAEELHGLRRRHEDHARSLQSSEESARRLAGGVANDLNKILSVLHGYTEVLHESLPKDNLAQNYVEEIRKAASHGAELSQKLLGFSRNHLLQPIPIELNQQLAELEAKIQAAVGRDVSVEWERASDKLWTKTDPDFLAQALLHLLAHLHECLPQGGKLTIRTAEVKVAVTDLKHAGMTPGNYAELRLHDHAGDLDDNARQHFFEPYFAGKEGQKSDLSLATANGIIRQAGGFIDVESQPGAGTQIVLLLPATDERPAAATAA
jgi:PAS domain S-box-containing protein